MKTSIKILTLTMLFGLIFIGCDNNAIENPEEAGKSDTSEIKSFVLTYSAPWDYFSIPWNTTVLNPDTLFVINTQESFAAYFPTATSAPDNFTDSSLLFVYGKTANKIVKTSYQIDSDINGMYFLDVNIELGEEQTFDVWYVSILVPKIPDVAIIPYKRTFSGAVPNEIPNDPPAFKNPFRDDITGKWKLLSVVTAQDSLECSGSDIIYNFSTKNKLTVTGSVPGSLPEGEYTYEYRQPDFCPTCSTPALYNMQIGDNKNLFCEAFLIGEKMVIYGEITDRDNVLKWKTIFALLK